MDNIEKTLLEIAAERYGRMVSAYESARTAIAEERFSDACDILLKLVEPTDSNEQYNWGVTYLNGTGVEKDYAKAYMMFQKAHEQGSILAARALGGMYYEGKYVSVDYDRAFELFSEAAEKDDAEACLFVGVMYDRGQSVEKNFPLQSPPFCAKI